MPGVTTLTWAMDSGGIMCLPTTPLMDMGRYPGSGGQCGTCPIIDRMVACEMAAIAFDGWVHQEILSIVFLYPYVVEDISLIYSPHDHYGRLAYRLSLADSVSNLGGGDYTSLQSASRMFYWHCFLVFVLVIFLVIGEFLCFITRVFLLSSNSVLSQICISLLRFPTVSHFSGFPIGWHSC